MGEKYHRISTDTLLTDELPYVLVGDNYEEYRLFIKRPRTDWILIYKDYTTSACDILFETRDENLRQAIIKMLELVEDYNI